MKLKNLSVLIFSLALLITASSCDKEVYMGPPDEAPPQNAKIFIDSKPRGAKIYLNGKNMGITTPDSLTWLESGNYTVTLKMNLFRDTVFDVNATDGQITNKLIDYYLNPGNYGKIYCETLPKEAHIIFDDSVTNAVTPYTFDRLFPGYYKVKFTYPEHRADSTVATVEARKTTRVFISLIDTTKWVTYNKSNSPVQSNYISAIAVDKNNIQWIGYTDEGVSRFDGKNWVNFKQSNTSMPLQSVNSIAVDSKNRKWIATANGLILYDDTNWQDLTPNLPSIYVTSIAFDKTGNVWIGTLTGLVKYDGTSWQVFNRSNSKIPGDFVRTIAVDSKNRIWIGTAGFGIGVFDGSSWTVYNMSNMHLSLNAGNSIARIGIDNNGTVWAAHSPNEVQGEYGGLSRFDGSTWLFVNYPEYVTRKLDDIYIDPQGRKWLCSDQGIGLLDSDGNFLRRIYNSFDLVPSNYIKTVCLNPQTGDMWVGSFGAGVAKFKKGNF